MDLNLNFNLGADENVAPDNTSSAIQTDPDFPNNAGDPDLMSNPLAGLQNISSRVIASSPGTFIKQGPDLDYDLVNKYKGTSAYSPYMNPYGDAEKRAAENWSMWDAVSTGLSGLTDNAIHAGKEAAYGWVRAGRALTHFDTDYLTPSPYETEIIATEQEMLARESPIYFDPGSNDDIFTRQSLSEFMKNIGFTFGTLGWYAAETAAMGGAFKLLGKIPSLFKASAVARSANLTKKAVDVTASRATEQILEDQVKKMFGTGVFTGSTIMDNALNVASRLPIIGAVADAGKILKAGSTLQGAGSIALTGTEIAKIGAGGLKRAFSEWNFAAAEAAIESGSSYGEVYDYLYDMEVEKNNGIPPTGEALQNIRDQAMDAAGNGYGTNFLVLALMNKIQFGNIFRNFGTDSRFISLLRNEGDRVLAVSGVTRGGEQLTKLFPKGYWGAIGHRSEIVDKFGKATFYREVGRDLLRGVGRMEISEGIQENIQEGTNEFLKSYYADLYDDDIASWGASFKEAFDSQTTKRGFKTFLQGALTGFAIRPITGAAEAGYNAYLEKKAKAANPGHVDALQQTLNRLNLAMAKPEEILKENHRSIKEQIVFNEGMTVGASRSNKYQYLNNKESSIIALTLDAKRTGTFGAFKSFLSGYGESLSNKEFEEATGIDLKAEGFTSASEYTSGLVQKLDRYSEIYDKYNKMFGDYLSYESITKDDYAKQRFSFAQAAIRDAIRVVAFNEAKAENATVRAASIAQNISQIRGIGQAAASNFNNITNYGLAAQQIAIIDNEIKTLQESGPLTPETRKLIKLKKRERDALQDWNENAYVEEVIAQDGAEESVYVPFNRKKLDKGTRSTLNTILTRYYNAKNEQSGKAPPILATDVDQVLDSINDYQKLDRDTKEYLYSVNLLSDPANMIKAAQAYEDARVAAYARLAHDTYMKLADESEIFADYVKENPKELEHLLKVATSPFASYDSIKSVMESVAKINKLVEDDANKAQKTSQPGQPVTPQQAPAASPTRPGAAVNIGAMNEEDGSNFILDHYESVVEDGQIAVLKRYYKNSKGNIVTTHTVPMQSIIDYYVGLGDTEVTADDIEENQGKLFDYAFHFEQSLFNLQNPSFIPSSNQAAQQIDTILYEVKKLYNLVGRRVTYLGKPGVFEKVDKIYQVRFDDGDIIEIGPAGDKSLNKKFQWVKSPGQNDFVLTDVETAGEESLDNYPYLQLAMDGLTPEEAAIIGDSLDAVIQRVQGEGYNVKYIKTEDYENIQIGEQVYTVERDPSGLLDRMTSTFDKGTIVFTRERADQYPDSLDSKYIAIANMMYLRNLNATDGTLSEEQIDTALNAIEDIDPTEDPTIVPANQKSTRKKKTGISARRSDKPVNTSLSVQNQADRIMQDIPDTLAAEAELMLSGNPRKINSIPVETQYKIRDWALGAIDKLTKLDPENTDVIGYITLLNDNIIVPVGKKHGRSNTKKQPKKAVRKESKTTKQAARSKPKPGEPTSPTNYKPGSITEIKDQVEQFYEKKDDELAVKIEELLPSGENLFNPQEIKEAAKIASFSSKTYNSQRKKDQSIEQDPFDNPPFSCI